MGLLRKYAPLCSLLSLFLLLMTVLSEAQATALEPSGGQFQPASMRIHPTFRKMGALKSFLQQRKQGAVLFDCQRSNSDLTPCYGPEQIRHAYGFDRAPVSKLTGKDATIVIVVAFGSPTINADYANFNKVWKLPTAPLKVSTPFGVNGTSVPWAFETTLDVQWAHAMAPEAALHVVVARSADDGDVYKAMEYAVQNNLGDVLSLSFGELETCLKADLFKRQHELFELASKKGITVLAASGDTGAALPDCETGNLVPGVSTPASDPAVTAVGGTRLHANLSTGTYMYEESWKETDTMSASGGGYSTLFTRPIYQNDVHQQKGRGLPDIALNASTNGGVIILHTPESGVEPEMYITGGTSAATPEMAGLVALTIQAKKQRLGALNPFLYEIGKSSKGTLLYRDIVRGNNNVEAMNIQGFTTQKGWDPVTGWGTPRAHTFVEFWHKGGNTETP